MRLPHDFDMDCSCDACNATYKAANEQSAVNEQHPQFEAVALQCELDRACDSQNFVQRVAEIARRLAEVDAPGA